MMNATRRTPGNRLMGPGYATVLKVIVDGPATWVAVAAATGTARVSAQTICHGLRRQRIIHIAEWRQEPGVRRLTWCPAYAIGDGVDAPCPVYRRAVAAPTRYELLAFCDVIRALQVDSWHGAGLAKHLGHGISTTRKTIRALHALGLVAIDDYILRANGGAGYPLYTWNPGAVDAVKPAKKRARVIWEKNNAFKAARRQQVNLMHGMVHGVSPDGRMRSANRQDVEVTA